MLNSSSSACVVGSQENTFGLPQEIREAVLPETQASPEITPKRSTQPIDKAGIKCDTAGSQEIEKTQSQKPVFAHITFHASNEGPCKWYDYPDMELRKDGDCGDGKKNPFPKDEVDDKFWAQRTRLWSRYEDGIKMDRVGWFSVTPEVIANHTAEKVAHSFSAKADGIVVLDAFAGVGGNTVAFACHPKVSLVLCVDTNLTRLEMAAWNCRVYGVHPSKVVFVCGDSCEVMQHHKGGWLVKSTPSKQVKESNKDATVFGYEFGEMENLPGRIDTIFMSPPWGGVSYTNVGPNGYTLSHISVESSPAKGLDLLKMAKEVLSATSGQIKIIYFLPRNIHGKSVAIDASCAGLKELELEQNLIRSKLKAVTMYIKGWASS